MASRILNKEMEFFYNGEDSFEKMIEELNNRFSFQKVVFLTEDKNIQDLIFEHRKTIQFFPVYKNNLSDLQQDIACVVQCDSNNMILNRKVCFQNNVFFVV